MPAALRHHEQHAGGEMVRLDLVVDDDFQAGLSFDDLHDFIALEMPLPAAAAAEARREEGAVTKFRQPSERILRLRLGRVRPTTLQPDQIDQILGLDRFP